MRMKSSEALLPCPFCGGKGKLIIAPGNNLIGIPCYGVACDDCHTMIGTTKDGVTDFFRTPVEAINAWNRRYDMPVEIIVKEIDNEQRND